MREAAAGFVVGVAAGALALYTVWVAAWERRKPATQPHRTTNDASLLDEQLSRSAFFFGDEGQANVAKARVIIIGLGGVGSHAAHMLARTGVSQLTLVDFDLVTLSSLNRHALAVRADVGLYKVDVMAARIHAFNPHVNITTHREILTAHNARALVQGHDFVVDCIDDLATKTHLLEACTALNIPVISSLGAGGKADPTRLRIGTLADSSQDPLAMRLRARIAKFGAKVSPELVMFVFSTEEPPVSLLPHDASVVPPSEAGVLPDFRVRIMPVLGTMPALFGVAMASYALTQLSARRAFVPLPVVDVSRAMAHKLVQRMSVREEAVFGAPPARVSDIEAVQIITLARRKCAITGSRVGASHGNFELARWDPARPVDMDNCVLLTAAAAERVYKHHALKTGLPPDVEAFADVKEPVTQEILANVAAEMARVRQVRDWMMG